MHRECRRGGGDQVALVIGDHRDSVGAWRERKALRRRERLPPPGLWAAGTRHPQRHFIDTPDDLAHAATLVGEYDLHLDLTLGGGEVWRGLHNSYLGRQALGENGVDIDEGLLLLQEFGWIAVQFGNQEIE